MDKLQKYVIYQDGAFYVLMDAVRCYLLSSGSFLKLANSSAVICKVEIQL